MSGGECAWCGEEITGEGVRSKKLVFCSAECCEEYQEDLARNLKSEADDLDEDLDSEDLEEFDFDDEEELIEDELIEDDNLSPDDDDY
jgi:hypothetical protein